MKLLKGFLLFLVLSPLGLLLTGQEFSPPVKTDLYLEKAGFKLGYSFKRRQALWVSYILTAEHLQAKQVTRRNRFKADPEVKYWPVRPRDYSKSGFDKGHLAPAADMTYSLPSMEHSFLMTNISPQFPGCNRGIWKRLETQVRRWAIREKKLYVVTGPIFSGSPLTMGNTAVTVPTAFYKVVFDMTPPVKMIGFIVPNESSKSRVSSFAVPVDMIERKTNCNFFRELDDKLERRLEKSCDWASWEK